MAPCRQGLHLRQCGMSGDCSDTSRKYNAMQHVLSCAVCHAMLCCVMTKSACACRMNVHFAPPEFCSVKRRGGTVYRMNSSADVWSFGLVLAQVAGLHKVSNPGDATDSWVNFIAKLEGEYPVEVRTPSPPIALHCRSCM